MVILLTNDDGIYSPGIAALGKQLARLGEVYVVAPATEQSGVGHSITYLSPLIVKDLFEGQNRRGWAVEGRPADCVKLGVLEFCPRRPDLVVSGMNQGLNAGINVLYSGTVAAAVEGAFFGINSIAVSLEFEELAQHDRAADLARQVIEGLLERTQDSSRLYNLNIPTAAVERGGADVHVVPMGLANYGERFEKRVDPRGRSYYWAADGPPKQMPKLEHETDLTALAAGHITVTPLHFDLTHRGQLAELQGWSFRAHVEGESAAIAGDQPSRAGVARWR